MQYWRRVYCYFDAEVFAERLNISNSCTTKRHGLTERRNNEFPQERI